MRIPLKVLFFLILLSLPVTADAAEKLSTAGGALEDLMVDPAAAEIIKTVDLAGDVPLATYALVKVAGYGLFQKTETGGFLPWDGSPNALRNAGFAPAGDRLDFDVYRGSLVGIQLPMTVYLGYSTATELKFGSFRVINEIKDPELLGLLQPVPLPERLPSRFDLIDNAFEKGDLTEAAAMRLRLIGGYEPGNLPDAYRAESETGRSNFQHAVKWLSKNWETLGATDRETLLPYYVVPDDPRSYTNLSVSRCIKAFPRPRNGLRRCDPTQPWAHIIATFPGNPDAIPAIPERSARIHYRQNNTESLQQAEWIQEAFIQAYANFSDLLDMELDEDVYIYLQPISDYGVQQVQLVDGANRSVIGIRCGLDEAYTKATTAHELFHAFQEMFGMEYVATDEIWLAETTAVWSENFVYPDGNTEHQYLNGFFEDLDRKVINSGGNREYHTYPWYLFLTQWLGYNEPIRDVWEAQRTKVPHKAVMEHDYWDAAFHEFARWNWNQAPALKYEDNPDFPGDPTGGNGYRNFFILPEEEESVPVVMEGLSMFYYAMVVDDWVERLEIRFEGEGDLTKRRQALIRVDGTWHYEDWTHTRSRVFCRDWDHEKVESIILIYSNSTWDEVISENFEIDTTGFCEAQWRGFTKVTGIFQFSEAGTELTLSGDYTVHTVTSRWELVMNDNLLQDEEGKFKVESLFAAYDYQRTEEVTYHRECSLLWEKEREDRGGSVHLDYTDEEWQPTRFKIIFNEADEPVELDVNAGVGAEDDWITRRVNKESFDRSCIFSWKTTHGTSRRLHYDDRAGYTRDVRTPIDEIPVDRFSGTITIPSEAVCDQCWTRIEYDYSYR